jgi:hypothetical protein
VLGGALAIAIQSDPAPERAREYLRLARSVEETAREGDRLRAFLLADLARYREALPGAATGYLDQLEGALTAGYRPRSDDLAALRSLCTEAAGERESARRAALLHRCESLAARAVRPGLQAAPGGLLPAGDLPWDERPPAPVAAGEADEPEREEKPGNKPGNKPAPGKPDPTGPAPAPSRPVPTPAEVFPPRRPSPQAPQDPQEPDSPPAEPGPETERPGTGESAKRRDPVPA